MSLTGEDGANVLLVGEADAEARPMDPNFETLALLLAVATSSSAPPSRSSCREAVRLFGRLSSDARCRYSYSGSSGLVLGYFGARASTSSHDRLGYLGLSPLNIETIRLIRTITNERPRLSTYLKEEI